MSQLGLYKGVVRDAMGYLNSVPAVDATQTFYRANLPRFPLDDSATALVSQTMTAVPVWLQAGDTVTNLSFVSGATAAATPTNWWFALYSNASTPALLQQTADQTTGAWAADTAKTVALAAPVKISTTGVYWAACMVKATTVPSLLGAYCAKPVVTGETNIAQASGGAALVATASATLASPAAWRFAPYVVCT